MNPVRLSFTLLFFIIAWSGLHHVAAALSSKGFLTHYVSHTSGCANATKPECCSLSGSCEVTFTVKGDLSTKFEALTDDAKCETTCGGHSEICAGLCNLLSLTNMAEGLNSCKCSVPKEEIPTLLTSCIGMCQNAMKVCVNSCHEVECRTFAVSHFKLDTTLKGNCKPGCEKSTGGNPKPEECAPPMRSPIGTP